VTDKLTDHATWSVAIGRISMHRTAMRPNNTADVESWPNVVATLKVHRCFSAVSTVRIITL